MYNDEFDLMYMQSCDKMSSVPKEFFFLLLFLYKRKIVCACARTHTMCLCVQSGKGSSVKICLAYFQQSAMQLCLCACSLHNIDIDIDIIYHCLKTKRVQCATSALIVEMSFKTGVYFHCEWNQIFVFALSLSREFWCWQSHVLRLFASVVICNNHSLWLLLKTGFLTAKKFLTLKLHSTGVNMHVRMNYSKCVSCVVLLVLWSPRKTSEYGFNKIINNSYIALFSNQS